MKRNNNKIPLGTKMKHGTPSMYTSGCRCEACTKGMSEHTRKTGTSRRSTRKRYGCDDMTEQECVDLLKKQGGGCAICLKELEWPHKETHVDHDHLTGRVRGILCSNCNRGLGMFKDNPVTLQRASSYCLST